MTEKLQSHFFTVTETLNNDKSDSNQCYWESESAAARCSLSTGVSTSFTAWMLSSLITKHINNRQKNSFHVIGLNDVTATVGKTLLCKIWKSADAKKIAMYTLTMWYWILLNFKRPSTEYSIYAVRGLTHLFSKWFRHGSTLFVVFGLYTTRCFYSFTSFHYRMYVWYNFPISSQNSS